MNAQILYKLDVLHGYLKLLRAKHWIKNLILFAAPFFGGKLFQQEALLPACEIFVAFSLCASSVYVINDVFDVEKDRLHPIKKMRPLAAGTVSKRGAFIFAAALGAFSLFMSFKIGFYFFLFVVAYFLIQTAYSVILKHLPIIDLFCIASGFILRIYAGGAAFNVDISHWLFLTMFMISLVLAAGKRLVEIKVLNAVAEKHRKSLHYYSAGTLDEILIISSAAALISYALYTVDQYHGLIYTIPLVTFGLFRYLILSKQGIGDPTDAVTKDKWLAVTVVIWLILIGLIRYIG